VHPRYNDALYDIALVSAAGGNHPARKWSLFTPFLRPVLQVKTSKEVKFGPRVQPICLPLGPRFPDIRSDARVSESNHAKACIRACATVT